MTKLEIINLSLSHIGHANQVVTDEDSEAWRVSDLWFSVAQEELLSMRPWKFARKTAALVWVADDPTDQWLYSYRYPSDCLEAIKIPFPTATGSAQFDNVNPASILPEIPWDRSFDATGQLIYTNADEPDLEYTSSSVTIAIYPIQYSILLSYLLATYTAEPLMKGDMTGLTAKIQKKFNEKYLDYVAKDENERVGFKTNESAFTQARK